LYKKSALIFLPFSHNSRDWQTDKRTDRRTDRILIARPRLHSIQRGKNWRKMHALTCQFITRAHSYCWHGRAILHNSNFRRRVRSTCTSCLLRNVSH